MDEFEFFRPEEAVGIEVELVEAFLREAFAGCEVGRMCRQRREREQGIFWNATDSAEFFG